MSLLSLACALGSIQCDRGAPLAPPTASNPAAAKAITSKANVPPRKLLMIGWDGMSENVIGPLLAAGKLPHLAKLIQRGAVGPLATIEPTWSPVVWTSIITGKPPEQHGVTAFRHRAEGQAGMVLFDATERRTPALWNILSDRRITSAFVGYWVTWPAEPIRGVMVSDRFVFNRQRIDKNENPGGEPGEIEQQLQPPAMNVELSRLVMQPQDVTAAHMARFIRGAGALHSDLQLHRPEDELRMCYAQSESHARIAEHLLDSERPAVLFVHFQGSDIVSHYFWKFRFPDEWAAKFGEKVPPADVERFGGVIDAFYGYLDERLGRLLTEIDSRTAVMILSDHGFQMTKRPGVPTISGDHPAKSKTPGMIVLSGAGIKPGVKLTTAHVYDVLPTALALLELPPARDLAGKPLGDALSFTPSESNRIASYDDVAQPRGRATGGTKRDAAIQDRLKRLGYFAGDDGESASAPSSAATQHSRP